MDNSSVCVWCRAGGRLTSLLPFSSSLQYSGFGAKERAGEIDSALFAKLCKECGIINKSTCTKTDVDLIFTRVRPKSARKLNYTQFSLALLYLSEKRFPAVYKAQSKELAQQRVMELIASSPGPVANATKPDFVKFHDDKSTYTGVYAQGGPSTNDSTLENCGSRSLLSVARDNRSLTRNASSLFSGLLRSYHSLESDGPHAVRRTWKEVLSCFANFSFCRFFFLLRSFHVPAYIRLPPASF